MASSKNHWKTGAVETPDNEANVNWKDPSSAIFLQLNAVAHYEISVLDSYKSSNRCWNEEKKNQTSLLLVERSKCQLKSEKFSELPGKIFKSDLLINQEKGSVHNLFALNQITEKGVQNELRNQRSKSAKPTTEKKLL